MLSEKQLAANRQNAKASTGPKGKEGKHKVSHNALRHGLTGQLMILTPEEREARDLFCKDLIESLNPETAIERQLAHSVAEDHWRINRLRAAENNILAKAAAGAQSEIEAALDTADAFLREAQRLQLLSLYEQRINRSIAKNHQQLRDLQAERDARRTAALEEAKLLAKLSLSKGAAYNSASDSLPNGFVFSSSEIAHAIDRDNRLSEAKQAKAAQKPTTNPTIHAVPNRAA